MRYYMSISKQVVYARDFKRPHFPSKYDKLFNAETKLRDAVTTRMRGVTPSDRDCISIGFFEMPYSFKCPVNAYSYNYFTVTFP